MNAYNLQRNWAVTLRIIWAIVALIALVRPGLCYAAEEIPPQGKSEGVVGWTYFNLNTEKEDYAADPEEACGLTAANHLQ